MKIGSRLVEQGWRVIFLGIFCVLASVVGLAGALVNYCRGYRDRERGVSCDRCRRLAFPLGNFTTQYRCHACGNRFSGARHGC
jgi:hypothetical protein